MLQIPKAWWNHRRGLVFSILTAILFGVIEIRLFSIQVINRPSFLKQANANRIRAETIEPIRGGIYDRYGKLLVENRPSYTLYAHPWIVKRNMETIDGLEHILQLRRDEIQRRIARYGWFTFQPATVMRDVEFAQLAELEATRLDLPGIAFGYVSKRSYPLPEAVHLLGYVGERGEEAGVSGLSRFGLVGKHGLELIYEPWLGGKPGVRYLQVDAQGRQIAVLDDPAGIPPEKGWDLHLNIDGDLQRYAFDLMADRNGAVVAIDPRDGSVLTLLSLPDYDPSLFAGVMPQDTWESLINDPGFPLLNRTVQGLYPPGSTYKMAILTAAVEEGVIDRNFQVTCAGGLQLGRRFFACWNAGGHGSVKWGKAIQQSCDVFFYTLGMNLGVDKMAKYARRFGFGAKTGIDFNVENSGITPNSAYLDRKYGVKGWTKGQALNISIGQGDVLVTPVQLAVYTSAVATGKIVKPRIAEYLVNSSSRDTVFIKPELKPLNIKLRTLNMLREGMRLAVNEPRGTAYWLRRPDIVIAGKTGTAQNPHGEDHALFVAYAPFDDPMIAVAVVIEHGEHGSTAAAPVACSIIDRYMQSIYPGPRMRRIIPVQVAAEGDSLAGD